MRLAADEVLPLKGRARIGNEFVIADPGPFPDPADRSPEAVHEPHAVGPDMLGALDTYLDLPGAGGKGQNT